MRFLFLAVSAFLLVWAATFTPSDASAQDRGRGIKGGFTGQYNRLTPDQLTRHPKANKQTQAKKKKNQ
jgi:hypothetical protein